MWYNNNISGRNPALLYNIYRKVVIKLQVKIKKQGKKITETTVCDECKATITFSPEQVNIGEFGCGYIICPNCGKRTYVQNHDLHLTPDNVIFPKHFSHTSADNGAMPIETAKIQLECIHCLKEAIRQKGFAIWQCGDSMVIALDYDDETALYVTKNYYETSICKEEN